MLRQPLADYLRTVPTDGLGMAFYICNDRLACLSLHTALIPSYPLIGCSLRSQVFPFPIRAEEVLLAMKQKENLFSYMAEHCGFRVSVDSSTSADATQHAPPVSGDTHAGDYSVVPESAFFALDILPEEDLAQLFRSEDI
jgi:hypothetical protein